MRWGGPWAISQLVAALAAGSHLKQRGRPLNSFVRLRMDCGAQFDPLIGLLFWCLPIFAGYWIWRRKQIAGASISLGLLVLVLWAATFPMLILSFLVGFSKLEGNSKESGCWTMLVVLAVLTIAYVLLFRTLKAGPRGGDGAS